MLQSKRVARKIKDYYTHALFEQAAIVMAKAPATIVLDDSDEEEEHHVMEMVASVPRTPPRIGYI